MIQESIPTYLSLADIEHFHFLPLASSLSSLFKHFWPSCARAVHPHSCEGNEICSSAAHLKCQTTEGSFCNPSNPGGGLFCNRDISRGETSWACPWATCSRGLLPRSGGLLQLLSAQLQQDLGCRASPSPPARVCTQNRTGCLKEEPTQTLNYTLWKPQLQSWDYQTETNCKLLPGQSTVRAEPCCAQDTLQLSLTGKQAIC